MTSEMGHAARRKPGGGEMKGANLCHAGTVSVRNLHAVPEALAALHHNAWGHRITRRIAEEAVIIVYVPLHGGHERPEVCAAVACGLRLIVGPGQEELERKLLSRVDAARKLDKRLPCTITLACHAPVTAAVVLQGMHIDTRAVGGPYTPRVPTYRLV